MEVFTKVSVREINVVLVKYVQEVTLSVRRNMGVTMYVAVLPNPSIPHQFFTLSANYYPCIWLRNLKS